MRTQTEKLMDESEVKKLGPLGFKFAWRLERPKAANQPRRPHEEHWTGSPSEALFHEKAASLQGSMVRA